MWFYLILFALRYKLLDACMPMQNVGGATTANPLDTTTAGTSDSTTSTTTSTTSTTTSTITTTTQTPLPSAPCTACPPIYISGCLTPGLAPDQCASAAAAGVTYSVGAFVFPVSTEFPDTDYCKIHFQCPTGYTSKYTELLTGSLVIGSPEVFGYCSQSGTNPGVWYYGTAPSIIEIGPMTCEPIITG